MALAVALNVRFLCLLAGAAPLGEPGAPVAPGGLPPAASGQKVVVQTEVAVVNTVEVVYRRESSQVSQRTAGIKTTGRAYHNSRSFGVRVSQSCGDCG